MSDEYDSTILNMESDSVFSSRKHLIAIPALRVFVWLMGILTFFGNIVSFLCVLCTNHNFLVWVAGWSAGRVGRMAS